MPRRRYVYLDRRAVELIAHKLAVELFTGYGSPLPTFQLMGRGGESALESALGLPRQPYYRTIYHKAGVLLRSLIKNHPLVDGNKRVGMTAAVVFLLVNDEIMLVSSEEIVDYAMRIAAESPDLSWKDIAAWLRQRTMRITVPQTEEEVRKALRKLPDGWQKAEAVTARLTEYSEALRTAGLVAE